MKLFLYEHLLLLHGALGSKEQFEILKEKLSHVFQIYTLNFNGHGDKVITNGFSL